MNINTDKIRQLRAARHWSQEELALACGLNLRTIQRLESSGKASMESAKALAAVLEVDLEDLLVAQAAEVVTPPEAVVSCLKNYFDFDGKSSRAEYFWFLLFVVMTAAIAVEFSESALSFLELILVIPLISAGHRRLRDAGRSGWWQLFFIVPFGFVVVIFILAEKSKLDSDQVEHPSINAT